MKKKIALHKIIVILIGPIGDLKILVLANGPITKSLRVFLKFENLILMKTSSSNHIIKSGIVNI